MPSHISGPMCPVAAILDNADIEHFCCHRKLYRTVLEKKTVIK